MFTIIIFEYELSSPVMRYNVPSKQAHKVGINGGYYKVQLVNEFGQIDFEYKRWSRL